MKWIFRFFKAGALICLVSMIGVVTIQVYARFFLEYSPHWTEEAARMFFIYTVAFGTGVGIQNGDFIRLDLIEKYLSPWMHYWLDVVTDAVVIAFAVFLFIGSLRFISLGMDELSPALGITMGLIFISIAIIGCAIAVLTLVHLLQNLNKKGRL